LNPDRPGYTGVLLFSTAMLAGIGMFVKPTADLIVVRRIALIAFVLGPLVAATFHDPRASQRALIVVPFASILAVLGTRALIESRRRLARILLVFLLALAPLQFILSFNGIGLEVSTNRPAVRR
jgi:hypothetical protein